MILTVSFEKSTYNELPYKFEAGTPNISGAVGLAAAMDYVEGLGHRGDRRPRGPPAAARDRGARAAAGHRARSAPPPTRPRCSSFTMKGVHPHDLGTILDAEGVAVRTGHHCAMPVMTFFGVPATARASFACYNNEADVAALVAALRRAREVFG